MVAASLTVNLSVVKSILPPSPSPITAVENKPLLPPPRSKAFPVSSIELDAVTIRLPAAPEPAVLTAICAPSERLKFSVLIVISPLLPVAPGITVANKPLEEPSAGDNPVKFISFAVMTILPPAPEPNTPELI